jgi:hypothetical protein
MQPRPVSERAGEPLTSLLDFTWTARRGQPPTKKLRYCTDYFKARPCDRWLRDNADRLGRFPVLVTGERWRESDTREDLPEFTWRFGKDGMPRKGWDVLWWRPILPLPFHRVASNVIAWGGEQLIHPGYFFQGATIESLTDPLQDERGRPRLSCVVCIFTSQRHLQIALNGPFAHIVRPYVEKHKLYERLSGKTWQQRGPLVLTGA